MGLDSTYATPGEAQQAMNWAVLHQAATHRSAFIAPLVPYKLMIRRRLYASTCRLISVCTCARVFVRKCVAPIQNFSVPNTCSTVLRRCRILPGLVSRRRCIDSKTASCSQRRTRRSLSAVVHRALMGHCMHAPRL